MPAPTLPLPGDNIPDSFPSVDKVVKVVVGSTSGDVTIDSQAAYTIMTIPQYAIIRDLGYRVQTAFTASVTLAIGDTDDSSGWVTTTMMGATVADTGINWVSRGLVASGSSEATTDYAAYAFQGVYCDTGARVLEVTAAGANPATGELHVYVVYNMAALQRNFAT